MGNARALLPMCRKSSSGNNLYVNPGGVHHLFVTERERAMFPFGNKNLDTRPTPWSALQRSPHAARRACRLQPKAGAVGRWRSHTKSHPEEELVHLADSRADAVIDPSACKLFRNGRLQRGRPQDDVPWDCARYRSSTAGSGITPAAARRPLIDGAREPGRDER